MPTDRDRLRFIETVERLHNWIARTRQPPAAFIQSNRQLFDELIRPVVAPLAPKIPRRQARRRPRPWRWWNDLPAAEQACLLDKLARRQATQKVYLAYLTAKSILTKSGNEPIIPRYRRDTIFLSYRISSFAGFSLHWILSRPRQDHSLPAGTPTDRLHAARLEFLQRALTNYNCFMPLDNVSVTFVADLHPDDVEFTLGETPVIIVDQGLKKLHDLFTEEESANFITISEWPLAASLFLSDAADNVQVYYCALLKPHRSSAPTLERAYVARAYNLATASWRITARFKRASNALTAGLKLYGEGAAARIQPPTAAEGGVK